MARKKQAASLPCHKSSLLLLGLVGWMTIALLVLGVSGAQLNIPTDLNTATAVFQDIIISSNGLDEIDNPNKVKVYADNSIESTFVVDGFLEVTSLVASGTETTYLVTTDNDGILSFVDIKDVLDPDVVSSQWTESTEAEGGIFFYNNVGIGTEANPNFQLNVAGGTAIQEGLSIDGQVSITNLWNWISTNGDGLMTVDMNGNVSMTKVSSNMFDSSVEEYIQSLIDENTFWEIIDGDLYYNNGKIGVLTDEILEEFHVNGDILSDRLYLVNGEQTFTQASDSDAYWYVSNNTDIRISNRNNNVAIGNIDPQAKLDVNGDVIIRSENNDSSGLTFANLNMNTDSTYSLQDVNCKTLGLNENGEVVLVDMSDVCESLNDDNGNEKAPKCNGETATIWVNSEGIIVGGDQDGQTYSQTLVGTDEDDVIVGTDGNDQINGNSGDDIICGLNGTDNINGNNGNDIIFGGDGNDQINGNNDDDVLCAGNGNDTIQWGNGSDKADGQNGVDNIDGGNQKDECDNGFYNSCEDWNANISECKDN